MAIAVLEADEFEPIGLEERSGNSRQIYRHKQKGGDKDG